MLNKDFVVKSGNITRAVAEKDILQYIRHPFIVRLYYAFQSNEHLFLCLTYIGGGELFTLMDTYAKFRQGGIPQKWAKFYAVEIALALDHLHEHSVLYRDLKPENIMLGLDGHICITDFGLAMEYDEEEGMEEIAGTPCYICPDVFGDDPPTEGCDWWSFGIIVYELLFGKTPFGHGAKEVEEVFRDIQIGELRFPKKNNTVTKDSVGLLSGLLDRNVGTRFGFREIESHPWFGEYDFKKVLAKGVRPPYFPAEMKTPPGVDLTSVVVDKDAEEVVKSTTSVDEEDLSKKFSNFEISPRIEIEVANGSDAEGEIYEGQADDRRLRLTQVF